MKRNKRLFFITIIILFFAIQKSNAAEYAISFTNSGIVTTLDSIIVLNHTKGTKAKLAVGDVLSLNVISSIHTVNDYRELVNIYPNPVTEKSYLTFYAKQAGSAIVKVQSLDGKTLVQTANKLTEGEFSYELTLPKGTFIITIDGSGFSYSAKAISKSTNNKFASVRLQNSEIKQLTSRQKSKSASVNMEYQQGDKMLYKAYSGNYCNTYADVPASSKTVNFRFAECKDASGNYYYNFVTIGTQVWMVDNLRTSKFNNGVSFNNYTNNDTWKNLELIRKTPGWCYFENDASTDVKYGKLYNHSAVSDERGISPTGWHVPTREEWQAFEAFLNDNGYNFEAPAAYNSLNKSLAANTDWVPNTTPSTPGNDLSKNNSTGFTALPGGYRASNGVFYGGRTAWWAANGDGYTTFMWMVVAD